MSIYVRIGGKKAWIYEKLLEIKAALNGTWSDVLEYLLTGRGNIVLTPIRSNESRTRPIVKLKSVSHRYAHEFRASIKKPWIDKYKARKIYSLHTHYNNTSCRLLFIHEGEDIVIIDAAVVAPPLPPEEYAKSVKPALRAILLKLNNICSDWKCKRITIDADATPQLSYLLEILKQ